MLSRFADIDRSASAFDELRREVFRLFEEADSGLGLHPDARSSLGGWVRASFRDDGAAFVLVADVPGMTEADVDLQLVNDVLTLRGERKLPKPEGYVLHRQERSTLRFARSFALPSKVDPEKCTASVKDGVLTVTLPKADEARPRTIAVKAS